MVASRWRLVADGGAVLLGHVVASGQTHCNGLPMLALCLWGMQLQVSMVVRCYWGMSLQVSNALEYGGLPIVALCFRACHCRCSNAL